MLVFDGRVTRVCVPVTGAPIGENGPFESADFALIGLLATAGRTGSRSPVCLSVRAERRMFELAVEGVFSQFLFFRGTDWFFFYPYALDFVGSNGIFYESVKLVDVARRVTFGEGCFPVFRFYSIGVGVSVVVGRLSGDLRLALYFCLDAAFTFFLASPRVVTHGDFLRSFC